MLPLLAASLLLLPSVQVQASSVAAAWYASWHATEGFPLSSVNWSNYNTMYYAFEATTANVSSMTLSESDASLLPQFVSDAHANNVKAHIAIGGWGGGVYFSSDVATADNRTAFVKAVVNFVKQYDLDGINFDWEYPNQRGNTINTINANDTANFLSFLQDLRANPTGANITISAAVYIKPFYDSSGKPSTDVSGFAKVLDYVAIMNYDDWGSWSSAVGPNAPLNDSCAPSSDQQGSAVSAVKAWSNAGMPISQIVLGVPSYGHSYNVNSSDAFVPGTKMLAQYPAFNNSNLPGDSWNGAGTFEFFSLISSGFLTPQGMPAPGIFSRFDMCSQTPYVYNQTSEVMISYDDARSFAAKGRFISNSGLLGFAMYEAGGDYNDILINAIKRTA